MTYLHNKIKEKLKEWSDCEYPRSIYHVLDVCLLYKFPVHLILPVIMQCDFRLLEVSNQSANNHDTQK